MSKERLAFFKGMSEAELHEWSRRRLDLILIGECVAGAAPQSGLSKTLVQNAQAGTLAGAGKRTHTERMSKVAVRPSKLSEDQTTFLRYINQRGTLTFEQPGKATRLMGEEAGVPVSYISGWLSSFEEAGWLEVERTPEGGRPTKVCITDTGAKVARNRYLGMSAEDAVLKYLKDNGPVFGTPGTGAGGGRGGAAAVLGYEGKEVDLDSELLYGVTSVSHSLQGLAEEGAIKVEREHNRFIVGAWLPGTPKRRVEQAREAADARAGKGNVSKPEQESVESLAPPKVKAIKKKSVQPVQEATPEEIADALLAKVIERATAEQSESSAAAVFKSRCAELTKELEDARATAKSQSASLQAQREELLKLRTELNETIVQRNDLEERLGEALARVPSGNGGGGEVRQGIPPEAKERLARLVTELPVSR